VLQAIDSVPLMNIQSDGSGTPVTQVRITNMSMTQDDHDAVLLLKTTAAAGASSTITVTATNSSGETSIAMNFFATVVADTQNDPAFLSPVSNQSTAVNKAITFSVSGTDLENDALTFTANILNPNPNVSVSVVGSQITVTPTNGFVGPVQLRIGVSENGQPSPDTQDIVVAVGGRTLTAASGTPFDATEAQLLSNVAVGSFTDTAAGASVGDYTVSINWGDGHVSSGTLQEGAGGVFTVFGSNTYAQAGKYPVHVTVALNSSLGGNVATFSTTATVAEAQIAVQGIAFSRKAGDTVNNEVVATVIDPNPNPIVANFSAMIDWGDGSQPTPGIVQLVKGTIQVLGSHQYTTAGNFTITTTVRDSNSAGEVEDAVASATAGATIAAITPPPPPGSIQLTQGYIAGLYRTVLGREANTDEINLWTGALNAGMTRFQAAYMIEISPEHRLLEIDNLYTTLLLRTPTLAEKLSALNVLQGGVSVEQFRAGILASSEYFQNRANSDQATLLQQISIDVLGSVLPQDKQNYYTWVFSSAGSFKREDAVESLLHSLEAEVAAVQGDYQTALGRKADQGGAVSTTQLRQAGATDEAIRALLFSSDEGFARLSAPV
jgi:hypothetical protein